MRMVLENPKVSFKRVSSTIALHCSFTNHDMELSYCFLIFSQGNIGMLYFPWDPIVSCAGISMACFRLFTYRSSYSACVFEQKALCITREVFYIQLLWFLHELSISQDFCELLWLVHEFIPNPNEKGERPRRYFPFLLVFPFARKVSGTVWFTPSQ